MRHFSLIQPWPALLTPNLLRPRRWPRLRRSARSASSTYPTVRLRGPSGHPLAGHAPCIHSHLHRLATIRCEKCGPSPPLNVRLNFSLTPSERAVGNCRCQRGASPFPILASSDLRRWIGPTITRTECSRETYFRTAFWKVSGVTRSRRNP